MNKLFLITICPTCGSDHIQQVVRDVTRQHKGRIYIVPDVTFYDCSNCGEKIYDHEAMQKIEAYSPAYRRIHALTTT